MDNGRNLLVVVLGAVVAFVLQIVVAPYIPIMSAMPNFVAVYAMLLAVARPQIPSYVAAFVLGLLFDLISGAPVGALAFSLTLCCAIAASVFNVLNNDTLFVGFLALAVGLVLAELCYGVFMLALGYNAGIAEALVFRALPCAVYDIVFAFVLYPLMLRLFAPSGPTAPPIASQLR